MDITLQYLLMAKQEVEKRNFKFRNRFTLTGGETYQDRGIIPRVISYIYKVNNKTL